ncbi:MAG: Inositol-monophosphatase [Pseudomonadota bacterium]|jgi:myo-inositol-1(or 4)-monophosphatase
MQNPLTDYLHFTKQLATDVVSEMRNAETDLTIEKKGRGDWFSALDLQLERLMRQRILRAFPTHGFLGEEDGGATASDWLWIVDPIDGSMNFLRGLPHYSVSIALAFKGEPVVACVADPVRQEFFTAARGMGAKLNDRPIKASSVEHLADAVVATVFPKPEALEMSSYAYRLERVLGAVAGARRAGSMALDLAYLAAGRVDAFWAQNMGPWDAAAGVLLIREAGGEIFTLDGLPWLESRHIAASTMTLSFAWRDLLEKTKHPSNNAAAWL